jgi:outer membrane receptor protein involved in Fe transport
MHKTKNQLRSTSRSVQTLLSLAGAALTAGAFAQTASAPAADTTKPAASEEDVVVLSPFEVTATATSGYAAATTLAGNRLNTELRDIGSAVSVVTNEFLTDVGATDNKTLLQYTTGSEVGGMQGNFGGNGDGPVLDESGKFINPNQNTRIRGLTSADNTRDFFLTDIPWEGYAVDGVDLQRGPNSILFGMGSPSGIINTRTKAAMFRNANEVQFRLGSYGANRQSLDVNRVLIEDQLALRIAAVRNDDQFKQEPAYSKDERVFGALRYEPAFLKKNGMRTILKANYEAGRVRSNNPRTLPLIDNITPWFYTGTYTNAAGTRTFNNLNQATFTPAQVVDDNTGRPNHGQIRPSINGGPDAGKPNPAYNPWVGNFASQYGGAMVYYNANSTDALSVWANEPPQTFAGAITSTGAPDVDKEIKGQNWQRPSSIAPYNQYAKNAGLKYSQFGVYKNRAITDSSIFDYYNNLIDGPNKHEWQDFRAYNVSLAQTFLNEQLGFEITYNNEFYKSGRLSLLSGGNQAIYVDINGKMADGTTTGTTNSTTTDPYLVNEPFADGTPNPGVGQAFIGDNGQGNNSSTLSKKETTRATAFASHDFSKDGKSWALRLLGKHTVTGMFAVDEDKRDDRSWIRYTASDTYAEWRRLQAKGTNPDPYAINASELVPNFTIYLGSAKDAVQGDIPLQRPTEEFVVKTNSIRTFNGTWKYSLDPAAADYVNPGALWYNDYYPDVAPFNTIGTDGTHGARISEQSENPNNYIGWGTMPLTWVDSEESAENRLHNTTSARLTKSRVVSSAFVWQGHFWDNALVGTWGVRQDIAKSWTTSKDTRGAYNANKASRGVMDLSPENYYLNDLYDVRRQVTSHSWMAVAHLADFPGLKQLLEKSPVVVSLFYSKSTNFQPAANRVDIYNTPLAAPTGESTDKGILLETRDGKYSLKINKYETKVMNASNNSLDVSFIGGSQAWGGNWVNRFEYNWTGDTISTAVGTNDPNNSMYNYGTAPGETLADAQVREAAAISAWRAWQKSVDPRLYTAWKINLNDLTTGIGSTTPSGVAVTEDSVSKGYEIEFNAQVTKNWRLTFNATKTSAVRTNIGGAALTDFVTKYEKALNTTAAGDLRIWWGGAGNETTLYQWNANFGSAYHMLALQEGSNVPELRKWRFNAISNYDFDQGFLKGVNVGMGVRYESSIVIGYPVIDGAVASQVFYDLANPYRGSGETNFDFWVGYRRKVWKDVEWNIQLNVRNAFVGNELVPINVQPDGSYAGYRIRPPQTWQLTNTFRF